ncbi:MAG: MFS transporter [Clostridia bacterium]|nr:MFS transporter [Clostridia bacterium]
MTARRSAAIVNLTGGMSFFSQQLILPVVSVYAADLGLSPAAIGALAALYGVLPAVAAVPAGRWGARFGHRAVLVAGALGTAASTALYALSHGFASLALAQVVAGLARMLTWVSAQTAITEVAEGETRERMVAAFTVYTAVGMAGGPVVGGLVKDEWGYGAAFLAFGATGVALLALALLLPKGLGRQAGARAGEAASVREAGRRGGARGRAPSALQIARVPGVQVALGFSFVSLFALGARQSFLPVYMDAVGYSQTRIGLVLTAASLAATAVRPLTPYLLRTLGQTRLLALAMAAAIGGIALAPLFRDLVPLFLLVSLHGLGSGFHQPLGLMLIAEHTRDAARGAAVGLRAAVNNVATAASPLILGVLAAGLSLTSSFILSGLASALLAWAVMRADRRARSAKVGEAAV